MLHVESPVGRPARVAEIRRAIFDFANVWQKSGKFANPWQIQKVGRAVPGEPFAKHRQIHPEAEAAARATKLLWSRRKQGASGT
ncbi:MAG: hypothetical protein IJS32_09110 [Kiritimatiellae bacterium]|nr:hypothetical protein [Kiritimatiellia bacterium]